jgi:hypothetical protein
MEIIDNTSAIGVKHLRDEIVLVKDGCLVI